MQARLACAIELSDGSRGTPGIPLLQQALPDRHQVPQRQSAHRQPPRRSLRPPAVVNRPASTIPASRVPLLRTRFAAFHCPTPCCHHYACSWAHASSALPTVYRWQSVRGLRDLAMSCAANVSPGDQVKRDCRYAHRRHPAPRPVGRLSRGFELLVDATDRIFDSCDTER
jgi:hypothetical protein